MSAVSVDEREVAKLHKRIAELEEELSLYKQDQADDFYEDKKELERKYAAMMKTAAQFKKMLLMALDDNDWYDEDDMEVRRDIVYDNLLQRVGANEGLTA